MTFFASDNPHNRKRYKMSQWQTTCLTAILQVLVIFLASLVGVSSDCERDAPDDCDFTNQVSSCRWSFNRTLWTFDSCGMLGCAYFGGNPPGANMTSRKACSSKENFDCLQIRYLFNGDNNTGVNVFIRDDDGDERQVWNSTGQAVGVWYTAGIPIREEDEFQIVLQGRKYGTDFGTISIDFMKYFKFPCSNLSSTTVPLPVTTPGERTTTESKASTDASTDGDRAGSNAVGVAVGVVLVILIAAVAVVIFILYRRKQLHLLTKCFSHGNDKERAGIVQSHNGKIKDDKRRLNTDAATPRVSGYDNHAATLSESSDTYYSAIKDTDGPGDSAVSHYSTIDDSQSPEGKANPRALKPTDDNPYEIATENGHSSSKSTTARNATPTANLKDNRGQDQNNMAPASKKDNGQSPSDYAMAQVVGDEATGVYHCLEEEDSYSKGEGGATAVYHYAKDPGVNEAGDADAAGMYHILEEESSAHQPTSVYHVPKGSKVTQQQNTGVKSTKGQTGNYNTLDFAAKSCGQQESEAASGGVYNHLNDGSDDLYNEVDREKKSQVIDGEYSHIK